MGFGRDPNDTAFAQDVAQHVRAGELYVARENGNSVAFRILKEPIDGVLHLAGAAKIPGSQRHLVRELTYEAIKRNGHTRAITTRTGSDFVLDEMLHLCDRVAPFSMQVDDDIRSLLSGCGLYPNGIDPHTLVIPNNYGGQPMLDPSRGRPESHDSQVAKFMRRVMPDTNYYNGDAIVLVGKGIRL